ncbi:MAG: phosphatidylglycerophosphatase A family protein [Planctomycetota bacterium]|jgi:phosphatidylglycerophosphatase A
MKRMLASCFGLGRLPVAPGTWGSLPPAVVFAVMCHFNTPPLLIAIMMAAFVVAGSVVCVKYAPAVIAATGKADTREIVADEFAGQAVTFLTVPFFFTGPLSAGQIWTTTALGFLVFRILDIAKPWPIRKLEKLPEGWGVLADDLLAGVCAGLVLAFCVWLWIVGPITALKY